MSWVAVGVAGAGATMSYLNNQQAKKRDQSNMEANAEAMRYSPWTGVKPQMQGPTANGDAGAVLSGAAQGAMLGSQFRGASSPSPSPVEGAPQLQPANVGDSMPAPQAGPNLGGAQMAQHFQSPNMPSQADMAQMGQAGELAQGYGSPWQSPQLKKPTNFYSR